jgi:hypothetical protein
MRKTMMCAALAAVTILTPELVGAQSNTSYPNYRIRYLQDLTDRDEGQVVLVEEGVFNTTAQANEVINILAHLVIAHQVDCSCVRVRRDVLGVAELEDDLMGMLSSYGYVSRLVPSSEVSSLPSFVRVRTPYLTLYGDGFRDSNTTSDDDPNPTFLNPSGGRQYARVDNMGIFVDTRLKGYVDGRVSQILGGGRISSPSSLCNFAARNHSPDDMISWVLIPDLRATWGSEGAQ